MANSASITYEDMEKLSVASKQIAQKILEKDLDQDGILSEAEVTDAMLKLLLGALGADSAGTILNPTPEELSTTVTEYPTTTSAKYNPTYDHPNFSLSRDASKYGATFLGIRQGDGAHKTVLDLSKIHNRLNRFEGQFQNIQHMFDSLKDVYTQIGHFHSAESIISGVFNADRIPKLSADKIVDGRLKAGVKTNDCIIINNDTVNIDANKDYNTGNYNGIDSDVEYGFDIQDKEDTTTVSFGRLSAIAKPSGEVFTKMSSTNILPNGGGQISSYFQLGVDKEGHRLYEVQNNKDFYRGVQCNLAYLGVHRGVTDEITTLEKMFDPNQIVTIKFLEEDETPKVPQYTKAPVVTCNIEATVDLDNQDNRETDVTNLVNIHPIIEEVTKDEVKIRIYNMNKVAGVVFKLHYLITPAWDDPLDWSNVKYSNEE